MADLGKGRCRMTVIKRIIVEDMQGLTVLNNQLSCPTNEQELRTQFAQDKLFILSLATDIMGTALVRVGRRLPSRF